MRRLILIPLSITVLAFLPGCVSPSRHPSIQQSAITPTDLKPGGVAVITIEIDDHFGIVKRVEGIIKEDATIKFNLKDDGVAPDEVEGDGIWSIKVEVPFNAPPGEFTFEAEAFDDDNEVVIIRDENGDAAPLSTSFILNINYPDSN